VLGFPGDTIAAGLVQKWSAPDVKGGPLLVNILPNFLVIGAAKSGTTSLHHYLREHPQIYLPRIKEINYFAYTPERPRGRQYWATTLDEYAAHFREAAGLKAVGEVTPAYMNSPVAAANIARELPDVRLVAILRDPADRAYSRYLMNQRAGQDLPPFDQIIPQRDHPMIREGMYYDRLKPYFDQFPRERIKVLRYDDLQQRFAGMFRELLEFLEVDPDYLPDGTVRHAQGVRFRSKALQSLKSSRLMRFHLKPMIPAALLNRLVKAKARTAVAPPKLTVEQRSRLVDIYRDDIDRLQQLVGMDLSAWTSTVTEATRRPGTMEPEPDAA
jgi:hypothetical protein